ncbi:hypothetical protein ES703_95078 [subsurface metagenome]
MCQNEQYYVAELEGMLSPLSEKEVTSLIDGGGKKSEKRFENHLWLTCKGLLWIAKKDFCLSSGKRREMK